MLTFFSLTCFYSSYLMLFFVSYAGFTLLSNAREPLCKMFSKVCSCAAVSGEACINNGGLHAAAIEGIWEKETKKQMLHSAALNLCATLGFMARQGAPNSGSTQRTASRLTQDPTRAWKRTSYIYYGFMVTFKPSGIFHLKKIAELFQLSSISVLLFSAYSHVYTVFLW